MNIKKYAFFNDDGSLNHTIETTGSFEEIPKKVVDVTDVTTPFNAIDKDGNLIWVEPKKTLEEVKQDKLKEIKEKFQAFINTIKSQYAPYEIESFQDQREEWRAWVRDNTSPTPVVNALAQARGIDREVLLQKIGQKVTQIVAIQGTQNKLEDQVSAAQNIDEVEAIDVDAVLQGLRG